MSERYTIRWTAGAKRAVAKELPEAVAAAAIELISGQIALAPRVVGKPLREPLEGVWSARRATYRVLYRIDDDNRLVVIEAIRHRRNAYQ